MKSKSKVAIYLRVSTSKQDYERQEAELKAYCKAFNLEIKYIFAEKISGAKDNRPEFMKLTELTKSDIDVILVWEISRLGRNTTTVYQAAKDFAEKGINVISLKEHFQMLDDNGEKTPMATIMLALFASMAELERETLIERTTSGKRNKMIEGKMTYTNKPPFGYDMVNSLLVINEEKAEIVRDIYRLYIKGVSIKEISKIYGISNINKILTNTVYYGIAHSKTINQDIEVPPIISKETYLMARKKAEEKRVKRAKYGSITNIFKGKVFCKHCGRVISKSGERWHCHCFKTSVSETTLQESTKVVMEALRSDWVKHNNEETIKGKIKEYKKQIKERKQLRDNLQKDYDELKAKIDILLENKFPLDSIKRETKELERIQKKINEANDEISSIKVTLSELTSLLDMDVKSKFEDNVKQIVTYRYDKTWYHLIYELYNGNTLTIAAKPHGNKQYKLIDNINKPSDNEHI
ncbi:MAG: recombinase family protein [Bacteroidaceae bacterium]|nr:recombinase family protein [Bacteroidaceae bacterium]